MRNPKFTAIIRGAFLAVAALFLTSCAAHHYDTGYKELVGKIETNPSADAIVGMWHRKGEGKVGGLLPFTYHLTVLLREDGTGLENGHGKGVGSVEVEDKAIPIRWAYRGGGVWVVWLADGKQGSGNEWRMSGDHLLRVSKVNVMGSRDITYVVMTRMKE